MTQITRDTSKGQLVALNFMQDACAASQTDVQLNIVEVASGATLTIDEYVMPFDGEIVGLSYSLDAAGTTGSLVIGVTLAGTEDAGTSKTVTTGIRSSYKYPRGEMVFTAGARIGVEITTSADWAPATSDINVTVWALVYLEGI